MKTMILSLLRKVGGLPLLFLGLSLIACQSGQDVYLYEVNEVDIRATNLEKNNLKSDLEFLSLVYSDLFGTTVPENTLTQMLNSYNSIGDKTLIADYLIRNMLNAPNAGVPSDQEMRGDVEAFIGATYKKFYVREASEYERWYLKQAIEQDPDLSPEQIYYAFLTSDEYRYY